MIRRVNECNLGAVRMLQSIRWAFNWKEWSPSERDFAYAISCVQSEEKDRLGRFVFRKDVRASLVGRLLMRKFVNEYAGIPYNEIVLARDKHNKPVLKNAHCNVSFNVSHQGNYTVLAGEIGDVKLGVDIMKLEYAGGKELSEFFRIMNRNFSPSEWDEIRNVSAEKSEQIAMFCRHWALKESYVKAIGVGIVIDLRTIDFKTNSKLTAGSVVTDTALHVNGTKEDWLFEETLLDREHCVAVALQENGKAPQFKNNAFQILDSKELLNNCISMHSEDLDFTRKYFEKDEHP